VNKLKNLIIRIFWLDFFYLLYINKKYNLHLSYTINKDGLHILREIFSKKVYDPYFPKRQNVTIVDVGGHYGFFSIYSAKKTSKHAEIWCLEPSSTSFEKMNKNIQATEFRNIIALNEGMSGNTGTRSLNLGRPQNHSLYSDYIKKLDAVESVKTISLDDFILDNNIENIDFMKVDCEGSEHEIFLNTSILNLKKIKVISMELHDMRHCDFDHWDTISYLESSGFKADTSIIKAEESISYFNTKLIFVR
jgi:FkbM family methyltransferase